MFLFPSEHASTFQVVQLIFSQDRASSTESTFKIDRTVPNQIHASNGILSLSVRRRISSHVNSEFPTPSKSWRMVDAHFLVDKVSQPFHGGCDHLGIESLLH